MVEVRRPPGRHQQLVGRQPLAVTERHRERAVRVRDRADVHPGQHPDALAHEHVLQDLGGLGLVRPEDPRAGLQHGHPDPEAREDLGQLAADRTTADDHQRGRQRGRPDRVAVGPVRRAGQPLDRQLRRAGAGVEDDATTYDVPRLTAVGERDPDPAGAVEPSDPVVDGRAGVLEPLDRDRVVPAAGGLLVEPPGHRGPRRRDDGVAGQGRDPAAPRPARRRRGSSSSTGCSRSRDTHRPRGAGRRPPPRGRPWRRRRRAPLPRGRPRSRRRRR